MKNDLIPLSTLIESVKSELLSYQKQHPGEAALLEVDEVEITASVVTTLDAEGKASVFALAFGTHSEQQSTQTVRVKMHIPKQEAPSLSIERAGFNWEPSTTGAKVKIGGRMFKGVIPLQFTLGDTDELGPEP